MYMIVYNWGWAVCFEGAGIGQEFQPLIFEIKGILVLCIIWKIYQNYPGTTTSKADIEYDGNVLGSNLDKVKLLISQSDNSIWVRG